MPVARLSRQLATLALLSVGFASSSTAQLVVEDMLLRPTNLVLNGNFGLGVTALGQASGATTFAVGAPQTYPNRPDNNSGEVYIFSASAGEIQLERVLTPPSSPLDASFGSSLLGIPDVTGDGAMDLVVAAPFEDVPNGFGGTTVNGGAVYLYNGATGGLVIKMIDPFVSERLGRALGWVPDVTGDGVPDILVGSPFHDASSLADVGRASVRNGATGQTVRQYDSPLVDVASARFGNAIIGLDDISGDGRGDVVIGEPGQHSVHVLNGQTGAPLYSVDSPSGYAATDFGTAIARATDHDGDGISDYWVGAPEDSYRKSDGSLVRSGQVYLISGATGDEILSLKRGGILSTSDNVGRRVELAGDLDRDGIEDVLVNIGSEGNFVEAFSGATGQSIARLYYANPTTNQQFGYAFAHVGDLDGNGSPDYVIGDYNYEERDSGGTAIDPSNAGAAYVYFSDVAEAELTGTQGWRLLSSPLVGASYESLLGRFWTQGFLSADLTSGGANVFTYSESTPGAKGEGWSAIPSQVLQPWPGEGIAYYAFTDDDQIAPGTQGGFPKSLSVGGFDRKAGVVLPVTYTDSGSLTDDGWNLLGNPFTGAIDWGADGWVRTGVDNVVYIYDAASESYQTWNGTTGTRPDGTIDPFEGFWVKAYTDTDLAVSVGPEAQTPASSSSTAPAFVLEASATIGSETRTGKAAVMVHPDALEGHDTLDAYALTPLAPSYLSLHTLDADGAPLDINALPPSTDALEIPLDVWAVDNGAFASTSVTLSWPELSNLPDDWSVTLLDTHTNTVIDLRQRVDYVFSTGGAGRTAGDTAPKPATGPPTPTPLGSSRTARRSSPRFVLQISGQLSVDSEARPTVEFGIERVQPNPVTSRSVLVVRAAGDGDARLSVYDALGREVAVLHEGPIGSGRHEIPFEVRELAAGPYVVRWQADSTVDTHTLTVVR